ncbi:DUF72 domain-containing protein [Paenibacillus sp. FSL M8-0228]|uniref:DUF72 domain-containing protein n=1 Tax=Paenibacillus TaxID=44249 RepID=UPI00083D036B|nr:MULTISPECIES: DUF72 domain-containing protein [Paenibacillus]MBO3285824.1 DUF72 domain-containing protein [Paenibacillus polymyxa]MBP1310581.1 uncharacterized protein YecE (DUF72 family) [Paenibacillus sp. 1182]ODB56514.1 hypothetical protein A7311_16265 [Paenibacillus polymyxa]
MIQIGLTGWGDHDDLYPTGTKANQKLSIYGSHFPVVEMDSSFYAVQPTDRMARWAAETPDSFSFLVKAYQGMTGHTRGKQPYFKTIDAMYEALHASIQPLHEAGKLKAVLFQYPPWFDCTRENVAILRDTKNRMGEVPSVLEFRHQSWFTPDFRKQTLAFMREEGWIHSVCDEPQAGPGSVPIVPLATDSNLTIIRLHGRNISGWNQSSAPNWREVRYLYRYNEQELTEWRDRLLELEQQSREVCVIFNNNSGGDAAANAKQLMTMLGMDPKPFPPRKPNEEDNGPEQLELF